MLEYMLYSVLDDGLIVLALWALFKFKPEVFTALLSKFRFMVREALKVNEDMDHINARMHSNRKLNETLIEGLEQEVEDLKTKLKNYQIQTDTHYSDIESLEDINNGIMVRLAGLDVRGDRLAQGTDAVVEAIRSLEESLYRRFEPTPKTQPAKILKVVKTMKGKKK